MPTTFVRTGTRLRRTLSIPPRLRSFRCFETRRERHPRHCCWDTPVFVNAAPCQYSACCCRLLQANRVPGSWTAGVPRRIRRLQSTTRSDSAPPDEPLRGVLLPPPPRCSTKKRRQRVPHAAHAPYAVVTESWQWQRQEVGSREGCSSRDSPRAASDFQRGGGRRVGV